VFVTAHSLSAIVVLVRPSTGRPANHCEIDGGLRVLLDGVVIGDGSYPRTASGLSSYLSLSSTAAHRDWVVWVRRLLGSHGLPAAIKDVPAGKRWVRRGKHAGALLRAKPSVKLATRSYRELLDERRRWYTTENKKRIPRDFDVTNPVALALWHMGDGSASTRKNCLTIKLHTNGFPEEDVAWLRDQFRIHLAIKCTISHWRGQPILTMFHREAVKFANLVRPHVVASFAYKVPDDPWKPGRCKVCSALICDRRSSARYCFEHRERSSENRFPNRPVLRCLRCDVPLKNKIYSGKYCPTHREEVLREHVARIHAKRAEARRQKRLLRAKS